METKGWQRRSGIMLCYPFEESRLKRWNTPAVVVQPKLDGDRCRVLVYPNGEIRLLSSEQNEIHSTPHIEMELSNCRLPVVELDGELYTHGMPHQDIHSIVSRKVELHDNFERMELHLFDIVRDEAQITRYKTLEAFYSTYLKNCEYIKLVPSELLGAKTERIMEQMLQYHEEGYEGIIVRSPFGHYERRRSVDIMKFKPRKLDYYTVVGYEEEISKDGVPKGSLGALILKSDLEQVFKVGSGSFLTRDNRRLLWEKKEQLPGQIAKIAYQHLTTGRVPRFPVLIELLSILPQGTKSASGVEESTQA